MNQTTFTVKNLKGKFEKKETSNKPFNKEIIITNAKRRELVTKFKGINGNDDLTENQKIFNKLSLLFFSPLDKDYQNEINTLFTKNNYTNENINRINAWKAYVNEFEEYLESGSQYESRIGGRRKTRKHRKGTRRA